MAILGNMKPFIPIESPNDVLPIVRGYFNRPQENFLVLTLDGAHHFLRLHHVTKGLVNKTIIHPREVFYPVIKDLASAVILVHNHPSGSACPSDEDKEISERMCMVASILGISLLDHVIIAKGGSFYSFRSSGKLSQSYDKADLIKFLPSLRSCV